MTPLQASKHYRCRFCGPRLHARLPVPQVPDGALLLGHLSRQHPNEVGTFLVQMQATEDIAWAAAESFEVIEEYG